MTTPNAPAGKFPPRCYVDPRELEQEKNYLCETIITHDDEIEYLSREEHLAIVQEQRMEAAREAEEKVFTDILWKLRNEAYFSTFHDYQGSLDKHWLYAAADFLEKAKSAGVKE